MNQVLIKLDPQEYDALLGLAEKTGRTPAGTARDVLREKLGLSIVPKFERLRAAVAYRTSITLKEIRAEGFLTFPIAPVELVQGMRHIGFSRHDNTFHRKSPDAFFTGHEAIADEEDQMIKDEDNEKVKNGH